MQCLSELLDGVCLQTQLTVVDDVVLVHVLQARRGTAQHLGMDENRT